MFPLLINTDNPLHPDIVNYPTVRSWLIALSAWVERVHGSIVESTYVISRNKELTMEVLNGMQILITMNRGDDEGHFIQVCAYGNLVYTGITPPKELHPLLSIKTLSGRRMAAIIQHDLSLVVGD
jgi:hypothetical protein